MEQITVKYSKLKAMIKALNKTKPKDDDDITFEFIIGSLFPDILDNIKKEMMRQHAMGYAEGLRDSTSMQDVEVRPIDESDGIQESMFLQ